MSDPEIDALRSAMKPRGKPGRKPKAAPAITMESGPTEPDANPPSARADTTRRERRRRDPDALTGVRFHLRVPRDVKEDADKRGVDLRWIRDDKGGLRVSQMQDAGWEPVQDADGKTITRAAGRADDTKMILVDKPKEWIAEERAAKRKARQEVLNAHLRGNEDPEAVVGYARGANRVSRSNS